MPGWYDKLVETVRDKSKTQATKQLEELDRTRKVARLELERALEGLHRPPLKKGDSRA